MQLGGLGYRVAGLGLGFRVQSFGFRVKGFGWKVSGSVGDTSVNEPPSGLVPASRINLTA